MKKLFAMLLVSVCLIVCGALNVYAAETTDLLTEDYLNTPSDGDWTWADGALTGANAYLGDVAMMSDVFIDAGEHVVLEATGTVNEGGAWGIILAEVDPSAPFASWICVNMDLTRPSTRLFGPGVGNPDEAELRNSDFVAGQPYTLAIEITEDNLFRVYFNGELYGERQNDNWIGAYAGLMTWTSSSTFTSYKLTRFDSGEEYNPEKIEMVVVDQPIDVRTMELGETTALLKEDKFKTKENGEFNWADGKLVAPNASLGDCAYVTDYFVDVDDHVYVEVTGNVTEGQAFGIMMPRNLEKPFESWMCMNMEIGRPSTRLFGPGFSKEVQLYSDDFTNNKPLTIGVEIDKGTFYLYSNGELYGYIENTDWQGCYLGLMTWSGSCEFTSFKVSEVESAEQKTLNPGTPEYEAYKAAKPAEAPAEAAPAETAPAETVPAETAPVETAPAETTPAAEPETVDTPAETEAAPAETAPQTIDAVTVCFAAALISGMAASFSKKRH